ALEKSIRLGSVTVITPLLCPIANAAAPVPPTIVNCSGASGASGSEAKIRPIGEPGLESSNTEYDPKVTTGGSSTSLRSITTAVLATAPAESIASTVTTA